jgi:16S rRNA (guanine527-N7)-methyltransferase
LEKIIKYFSGLSPEQTARLASMESIYTEWNKAINVISRKDIANFYTNHVLHSLSIAKAFSFGSGDNILDVGTGGGFPGIPLAIMFPHARFVLIDSVAKKIKVVNEVVTALGLTNVKAINCRVEEHGSQYRYVVTRAVAPLGVITSWTARLVAGKLGNRGIIALKGGDISEEIKSYGNRVTIWNINDLIPEPYFETKKIILLRI